jgi:bacterioferritin-associated ferredoxin
MLAGTFAAMIVCSCNVFTDHDVRSTLSSGDNVPRTTGQVYQCLGCSAQCGRCARTIRRIMDEALDLICPHDRISTASPHRREHE